MPTLSDKFRIWLGKLAPDYSSDQRGRQSAIARRIGWNPTRVNKLERSGKGKDVGIDEFERLARHFLADQDREDEGIWIVLREIAEERDPKIAREPIAGEQRFKRQLRRLFADNPERGTRVVENLIAQDALGYTDLISAVVHEIIEAAPNPRDAIGNVVAILNTFKPRRAPSGVREILKSYRQEYEKTL